MRCETASKPMIMSWALATVVSICFFLVLPGPGNAQQPWFMTLVSDDGNTVAKMTKTREWGDVVNIGFFGPTGEMRSEIVGRHKPYANYVISADGYLLIFGEITQKAGRFLSLYDPHGRLQWEIELEGGCEVFPLDVAARGYRTAARVYLSVGQQYLLLLDEKGSTVQKLPLKTVVSLTFCGDDKLLVVATASEALLFESETFELLRQVSWAEGGTHGDIMATSGDSYRSYIAVLDRIQAQEDQETKARWRVTVLSGHRGQTLEQEILPSRYEDIKEKALRYDSEQRVFVVETEEGTYKVTLGQ